jgi:multicomponent Na+:H+ antiporter subunit G
MDLSLREAVVALFLLIGVLFMLIAAIGLVRMPDLFLRASASSKGATLGVAAVMIASALYFQDLSTTSRALAVIIFIMLTTPLAAHMIGRTAYRVGVPFWAKTQGVDR